MSVFLLLIFFCASYAHSLPLESNSQILKHLEDLVNGNDKPILEDGPSVHDVSSGVNVRGSPRDFTHIRAKRSLRPPAHIADLLKISDTNPGLSGEVLYVARKACHVNFTIDRKLFRKKDVLKAELHIYKKALKKTTNIWRKKTIHAIVSIHQVIVDGQTFGSTKMIDSRLVRVDAAGWIKFDITDSVREWLKYRRSNKGLDIWVESIKPGDKPAKVARRFKFECSDTKFPERVPGLAVFFTDEGKRKPKLSSTSPGTTSH